MADEQTNLGEWTTPALSSGTLVRVTAGSATDERAEVLDILELPAGEHRPFDHEQTVAEYWSTQDHEIGSEETVIRVWFPDSYVEDTFTAAIGAQTYDYPVSLVEPIEED